MINLEIDGKMLEIEHGATVMDAANRLGIYVPHFCYHKKLSIAANCRMCLVEVEKAPKPLPACATPVTDGMKVWTHSPNAKKAQNGVMEFLLINHPLDCPICDQGGECQLQDLAVGYGKPASRYQEEKRVVLSKDVGPLVGAEEMSRCIQCTRCVRFGQEIAGIMELGMIGRGEHAEIVAFVGKSVDSELSGNMIDLCPVGALTSKPFRYSARTWELSRRKSISPHDALGSNLAVQVKQNRVMRVLPLENEEINECWLSDKDRYAYEALNVPQRLTAPMVRDAEGWRETDWQSALERVAEGLKMAGAQTGFLASPHASLEELSLTAQLAKALGASADHRLRQTDFSADSRRTGIPWLGMPIAELRTLDRVLVIGSFLRKDHPLIAHHLRQAAKRGMQLNLVHCADDDPLIPVANKLIVAPSQLVPVVTGLAGGPIGASLASGKKVAILIGNLAVQHPRAAEIHTAAQALAESLGATLGVLGEAANLVGGAVAGLPVGDPAGAQITRPRKAYVLLGAEPDFDFADAPALRGALGRADFVVQLSAFAPQEPSTAHVVLPLAPFTETSGTFVNCEGRAQSFRATVAPLGEARPGWKILRVLGNLLGVEGFAYESSEQVRDACLGNRDLASALSNRIAPGGSQTPVVASNGLERVADVPIHFADPLVRHAPSLQRTRDARPPRARMNARALQSLGLAEGARVRLRMSEGSAELPVELDAGVPDGCVRVAAAHPSTALLGALFGSVNVEAIAAEQAA